MINLFPNSDIPLAEKFRPTTAIEVVGQNHIWSEGTLLWNIVHKDKFSSLIFWGPPGTGKTSLARLCGKISNHKLVELSAVSTGVSKIRSSIDDSIKDTSNHIIFMDELHRLSKNQQDVLLPAIESGNIRFIGATTENPGFEVNNAILSRSLSFQFQSIQAPDLESLFDSTLFKLAKSNRVPIFNDDARKLIAEWARGDARQLLVITEALIAALPSSIERVDCQTIESILPDFRMQYDKFGDSHYDNISAYIKSIRAGKVDAALHYLAKMLHGGEDPVFIARRLVIAASEDIGNANPTALVIATSCLDAVRQIGMPEARIILSQGTTYLAASPKSNSSYTAIDAALQDIKNNENLKVPLHLKNAPTAFAKDLGHGKDYIYPHDVTKNVYQEYMPDPLVGRRYYSPSDNGFEGKFKASLAEQQRNH